MIDEIYDNVLSLSNQIGYIDYCEETNSLNPLRWSYNTNFNFKEKSLIKQYPVAVLSFDTFFRAPFSDYIGDDGVFQHIY